MKKIIVLLTFLTVFSLSFTQTRTCCPLIANVDLDLNELHNLNTTPITIITPPSGYGIKLVKPAVMWNYASVGLTFPSGEFVNVFNESNAMGVMHQFSDPAIQTRGIYSAYFFQTYEVVRNGQPLFPGSGIILDGAVKVGSTADITGGNTGDHVVIEIYYELIAL